MAILSVWQLPHYHSVAWHLRDRLFPRAEPTAQAREGALWVGIHLLASGPLPFLTVACHFYHTCSLFRIGFDRACLVYRYIKCPNLTIGTFGSCLDQQTSFDDGGNFVKRWKCWMDLQLKAGQVRNVFIKKRWWSSQLNYTQAFLLHGSGIISHTVIHIIYSEVKMYLLHHQLCKFTIYTILFYFLSFLSLCLGNIRIKTKSSSNHAEGFCITPQNSLLSPLTSSSIQCSLHVPSAKKKTYP